MYSVSAYGKMIADDIRTAAYVEALRATVRPGCTVIDIGAGTGILAFIACELGARKVYAIEPDDAIGLARDIARDNNVADRICFIQGLSTKIALPERADVIVSDLRGVLPLFQQHLPSIIDARARLLAPGGALIPKQDRVWAAVIDAPQSYGRLVKPWKVQGFSFKMDRARELETNTWGKLRGTPDKFLTEPQCWTSIDYETITSANIANTLAWKVTQAGLAHGFVVWFDSVLTDGCGFSNKPGLPELIYGSAFFPWSRPVQVELDDAVSIRLRADLIGTDYVWTWETEVVGASTGTMTARFRQSTFSGIPLSLQSLQKRANHYVPVLNDNGRIDLHILNLMNSGMCVEEIARTVRQEFPGVLLSDREARVRVGNLSEKYDRS